MKQLLIMPVLLATFFVSNGQQLTDSLSVDSLQLEISPKWSGYAFLFNDFSSVFHQEFGREVSINTPGIGVAAMLKGHLILGVFSAMHDEGSFVQRVVFPTNFRMKYRLNGVLLGYRFRTKKFYEFLVEGRVSKGHLRWQNEFSGQDFQETKMTILQPTVSVDLNPLQLLRLQQSTLENIMRLNISLGYKYVTGVDILSLENKDLSGLNIGVMVKIGYFK